MNETLVYIKLCFYLCDVLFYYRSIEQFFAVLISTNKKRVKLPNRLVVAGCATGRQAHLSVRMDYQIIVFDHWFIGMGHSSIVFDHRFIRMGHRLV